MIVYYCSVVRPDGTIRLKRVEAADRQSAIRRALQGEPKGSRTTARNLDHPVGARLGTYREHS